MWWHDMVFLVVVDAKKNSQELEPVAQMYVPTLEIPFFPREKLDSPAELRRCSIHTCPTSWTKRMEGNLQRCEAWDLIGTNWSCGSKLKSYCQYSDVNMDVTWFNLCKITTWSRNKMPEACCKAAHIWDLILFEEFHIFVRFISSLIDSP